VQLRCPQCGTVYDVSQHSRGHTFQCACGRRLEVGDPSIPPVVPSVSDPGLGSGIKVLLFFLNICFTPIVGLVWWLIIREDKPRTAKDVCTFTWIPGIIAIVLWILYVVFMVIVGVSEGVG
jgi:hypothetical protein